MKDSIYTHAAKRSFFSMEHASVVDTGLSNQIVQQFIAQRDTDVFSDQQELIVPKNVGLFDIIKKVQEVLSGEPRRHVANARVTMPDNTYAVIYDEHTLAIVTNNARHNEDTQDVHSLLVNIYGQATRVAAIKSEVKKAFDGGKMARVKWWFEGGRSGYGSEARDIYLPDDNTVLYPEFYPGLAGGPQGFLDAYMQSRAAVLLLAGEAGTGKTTLLRRLILDRKLTAHVIYEEKLMEKDSVFQSFLFDKDSDILIIEDADTILSDRDRDGNKMMSRFLSVSDGLIKLPNKKLVFTTNLSDFKRVDSALLRPGRCYAGVETRPLSFDEAQKAAKVAGLPVPTEKKTYTLAQLFNSKQGAKVRGILTPESMVG